VADTVAAASPTLEERRWLHDKYERLAAEEGQLSGIRTAYFATIGAVLLTGLVVLIADLLGTAVLFTVAATLLAALGILVCSVWTVLLHRTNDAQAMWREAALRLEESAPPVLVSLPIQITLRSRATVPVDLNAPYHMHNARFAAGGQISLLDRINPNRMMEIMPISLLAIWGTVLVVVWSWYLFGR
jgi:hypothetical protein